MPKHILEKLARATRLLLKKEGLSKETRRLLDILQDPYSINNHVKRPKLTKNLNKRTQDPLTDNMSGKHPIDEDTEGHHFMMEGHESPQKIPMDYSYNIPRLNMPR